MDINLSEILLKFDINSGISNYGNGHINNTYCTDMPKYILQRINTNVFKDPYKLMENIDNVTKLIRKKIEEAGGNPDHNIDRARNQFKLVRDMAANEEKMTAVTNGILGC